MFPICKLISPRQGDGCKELLPQIKSTLIQNPTLRAALLPCPWGASSWNLVLRYSCLCACILLPLSEAPEPFAWVFSSTCPPPHKNKTKNNHLTTLFSMYCWAPPGCQPCCWEVKTSGRAFGIPFSICHHGCPTHYPITHHQPFPSRLPWPWCTSPFLVSISLFAHQLQACSSDAKVSCMSHIVSCSALIKDSRECQSTRRTLIPWLWLS